MFCLGALLSLANRLTTRLEPLSWDQSKMERFTSHLNRKQPLLRLLILLGAIRKA
jgi:hypothetical protein